MRNEYGAEVIWAPFDLHPEYPPEGVPRPPSTGEMEARFADNGLAYDPPSIRANSLKALRLAEHARAEGLFDPMHARLMDALAVQPEQALSEGRVETLGVLPLICADLRW